MTISKSIKKRLIAYPIFFYLMACCSPSIKVSGNHKAIDKEILPYVQAIKIMSENKLDGTKMSIGFLSEKEINEYYDAGKGRNVLGVCTWKIFGLEPEIDINRDAWKYLSTSQRVLLMAHEIRHCQCTEGHTASLLEDECPKSFMYPSTISPNCRIKHLKRYVDEMKKGCD